MIREYLGRVKFAKKANQIGEFLYYCEQDKWAFFDYPEITDNLSCCSSMDAQNKSIGQFYCKETPLPKCTLKELMETHIGDNFLVCSNCSSPYSYEEIMGFIKQAKGIWRADHQTKKLIPQEDA